MEKNKPWKLENQKLWVVSKMEALNKIKQAHVSIGDNKTENISPRTSNQTCETNQVSNLYKQLLLKNTPILSVCVVYSSWTQMVGTTTATKAAKCHNSRIVTCRVTSLELSCRSLWLLSHASPSINPLQALSSCSRDPSPRFPSVVQKPAPLR